MGPYSVIDGESSSLTPFIKLTSNALVRRPPLPRRRRHLLQRPLCRLQQRQQGAVHGRRGSGPARLRQRHPGRDGGERELRADAGDIAAAAYHWRSTFVQEGAGQEELGAPQLPPRSAEEHPQKRQKVIEQKTIKFQI